MGRGTVPILMSLISFGAKWYPSTVFEDGKPRTAEELFPRLHIRGAKGRQQQVVTVEAQ
jgi:hypothetical protein